MHVKLISYHRDLEALWHVHVHLTIIYQDLELVWSALVVKRVHHPLLGLRLVHV